MSFVEGQDFNTDVFEEDFLPRDYDPERAINFGGTKFLKYLSGTEVVDVASSTDTDSLDALIGLCGNKDVKINSANFPKVRVTKDGILFSIGNSKIKMIITQDKGVFFNHDDERDHALIRRNFGTGLNHPERSRYFYEVSVDHATLNSLRQPVRVTVGIELSTLDADEIWTTLKEMKKENVFHDASVRTLINPYFRFELLSPKEDKY